jgi:MFS family permease
MPVINDNNRKWRILVAMGGVIGLTLLDETVVGVALPTIREELGMSQLTAHWVVNVYLLVFAGLAAAGRLGDLVGLHRLFIGGVTAFELAFKRLLSK